MNNVKTLDKRMLAGLIVLAVVVIGFPFAVGHTGYYVSIGIRIFVMAIYALSYNLLLGYTGIVSLGHALFFGMGASTTGILMLRFGWNFWATLIVVAVFSAVVALHIGFLTLRVKDI